MTVTGNLVAGDFLGTGSTDLIEVRDPADLRRTVGKVPAMTVSDVRGVYEAAREGARVWRALGPIARGDVLRAAAARLRAERDGLARIIVGEMGKTLAEATTEVTKAADFFDYFGGLARLPFGELVPDARPGTQTRVIREPLGVTLLITPWNDPLLTPARKAAPALIAGNAVVIKPATLTPLIVLNLARILHEAGVPAGVVGTVTGRVREMGDALLDDDALRAVSFTGSTEIGLDLQRRLAGRPVRLQTEMGGKNAVAVLADADLEVAADQTVAGAFAQAGQRCTATSRLVVVSSVAEPLLDAVRRRVRALTVSAGDTPGVDMGPVVSADARDEIVGHIQRAVDDGSEVVEGGLEAPADVSEHGAFLRPTVLRVTRDHAIWREEVFGPVLGVLEVDDEEAAVEAVNDSAYGLSAAVFTNDLGAAERFVDRVEVGQVSVNQPTSGWDIHHPFGGFGLSGSAFKEQGLDAIRFYTRTKTAAVRAL
ncbi:aldehyde dehydrogenase family protein [Spiractinospora alimapuensis]|uniref:aldehyde dehydrogenase family protein n=1 Tax=Spiractinospora alimapuensis TaxID=2820884 RepID=UPI001F43D64F|nr:aldehyde dehydrogenase family protein [Spiractinospora alimapuensis]QVQ52281.1 aldehyde dehydrogenase family protein [Spiractinospora alimapuensis]